MSALVEILFHFKESETGRCVSCEYYCEMPAIPAIGSVVEDVFGEFNFNLRIKDVGISATTGVVRLFCEDYEHRVPEERYLLWRDMQTSPDSLTYKVSEQVRQARLTLK